MFVSFGVGRFVADPVLHPVGETNVCKFSLAFNEFRKVDGERKKFTHFFDFEIWDKAAELIHQYRRKGDLIEITCLPRQQKWNDKETGEPRSKVVFRVNEFSFMPKSTNGHRDDDEADKEEDF